jgi:molybdopterin converting factor small subunit
MANVYFPSGLRSYTGGLEQVTIEAPRVRELLDALSARFPALSDHLGGMAVAIDGQIYNDADYQTLGPDAEIYLVPRIAGGSDRTNART